MVQMSYALCSHKVMFGFNQFKLQIGLMCLCVHIFHLDVCVNYGALSSVTVMRDFYVSANLLKWLCFSVTLTNVQTYHAIIFDNLNCSMCDCVAFLFFLFLHLNANYINFNFKLYKNFFCNVMPSKSVIIRIFGKVATDQTPVKI